MVVLDTLPTDIDERLAAADDELLLRQLRETNESEASLEDRRSRAVGDLGWIAIHEGHRVGLVHDAARAIGSRRVTDPHKTEPEPSRAEEIPRRTARRMGRIATRFSLNGPNGGRIRSEAATRPSRTPDSRSARKSELKSAEILQEQALRQARSRRVERIFSGGVGLGVTHNRRTRKMKRELRRGLDESRRNGWLSARESLELDNEIENMRITVPVKAVRKHVKKERRGAISILKHADQPIRKRIRSVNERLTNRSMRKTDEAIGRVQMRKELIEEELRRRGLLPPVATITPIRPFVGPTPPVAPPTPLRPRAPKPPKPSSAPTPPAKTEKAPSTPVKPEDMPRSDVLKAILKHLIDGPSVGYGVGESFPRMSPKSLETTMLKNLLKFSDEKAAELAPQIHAELQDLGTLKLEYRAGEGTGYWFYPARAQELLDNPDLLEPDEAETEESTQPQTAQPQPVTSTPQTSNPSEVTTTEPENSETERGPKRERRRNRRSILGFANPEKVLQLKHDAEVEIAEFRMRHPEVTDAADLARTDLDIWQKHLGQYFEGEFERLGRGDKEKIRKQVDDLLDKSYEELEEIVAKQKANQEKQKEIRLTKPSNVKSLKQRIKTAYEEALRTSTKPVNDLTTAEKEQLELNAALPHFLDYFGVNNVEAIPLDLYDRVGNLYALSDEQLDELIKQEKNS